MIEYINYNNLELAIIIRSSFITDGIEFFTNNNSSQQLGYMNRSKGYIIPPHRHNLIPREVTLTQEVLFIRSGEVRVDFYDNSQIYIKSTILYCGDVILLINGGHGFKMLKMSEIIEVKQGPYIGEQDKVRFEPIEDLNVIF